MRTKFFKYFFQVLILCIFFLLSVNEVSYGLYYRSFQSGNWNVASTWESSVAAGGPWAGAASTPTAADQTISILTGHVVRMNAAVTIDEVVVDPGGTLIANANANITVNNGVGVDLTINGTFIDSIGGVNSMVFSVSATWQISGGANLVKCTASSSNNWQSNYQGGIANIPANANWIIRKVGASNPAISTTNGGSQAYYPNFIYENYTSSVFFTNSSVSSYFNGNVSYPIIKGNFDVGGAGTNYVNFNSDDKNATIGVQVWGDMIVRAGNTYNNTGTGTEIRGDLFVDGTWLYDLDDSRKLVFSGTGNSTVWGNGKLGVYNLTMAKTLPANVTLNRPVLVDFSLTLTTGKIYTSATNPIIINTGATVSTVANNSSFVEGPCRKFGTEAFVFPVGMGNDVQPAGMTTASAPSDSGVIWIENFNNGCAALCDANFYSGPNGAWSVVNAGFNGSRANKFYVSCAEANRPIGICTGGCATGGDATLHVGASPCAACAICPSGDCGAIYDTLLVGGNDPTTDIRAISPPINTIGKTNLTIGFKFINVGDRVSPASSPDKAILEYSVDNGFSWVTLVNINRSSSTGGCTLTKKWDLFNSLPLPSACQDLPNLRIAFRWINNNNSIGAALNSNGSFAVDSVTIAGKTLDSYTAEYFHVNPTIVYNNVVNPPLDHVSRMEYWNITKEQGNGKRRVTLYWDGNSGGVTSLPDLRVAYFNAASWNNIGNTGTTGTTAAGTITSDSTKDWGPFTLASTIALPGNPLPVELLSFTGIKKNKTVELKWMTASELNNDYFTLQKSSNNFTYAELVKIKGSGTTNYSNAYYYTDLNPHQGFNFYKLFQTDFDGSVFEKGTVAVKFEASQPEIQITPDQSNQQILISFGDDQQKTAYIDIIDVTGKCVMTRSVTGGSHVHLKTDNLANGVYIIRIRTTTEMVYKRFFY